MADKALLVGINKYLGAPLAGCLNDVTNMARFITTSALRFDPTNVRLLTDERANTEGILERLGWLVAGLREGDRILFQFSGHGAQVATRSGSGEIDGRDECLCPYDFDWSPSHMILDKQLHEIFDVIPLGVKAIFISDSCHSGDLTKNSDGLGGRRVKAFPAPADIAWRLEAAKMVGMERQPSPYPNIVLISGCQSDQTSADASFEGKPSGALTNFLLESLKAPDGLTVPLPDIITRVRTALAKNSFSQVPQLEGPGAMINRPFFQ